MIALNVDYHAYTMHTTQLDAIFLHTTNPLKAETITTTTVFMFWT